MTEYVILVDENDNELGLMEKLEAHQKGILHRAFSVFIFNSKGELLLQQRAAEKYHSAQLWTNTCCSHPRKGETYLQAAHRRLMEEMGFDCPLEEKFHFIYQAVFDDGLIEHELDHVFIGEFNGSFEFNQDEVMSTQWISLDDLKMDMAQHPEKYTAWFKIIFERFSESVNPLS